MGGSMLLFHKETTPLSKLPQNIYYGIVNKKIPLIEAFKGVKNNSNGKKITKYFSINKFTLKGAYEKAIEYVYGEDELKEILKKYPAPNIHSSNLYVKKKPSPVYGIILVKTSRYLSGFLVSINTDLKHYFSVPKLGLKEAWEQAVKYRYTFYEPNLNDNTKLPKEYWDLINPKYKFKGEENEEV